MAQIDGEGWFCSLQNHIPCRLSGSVIFWEDHDRMFLIHSSLSSLYPPLSLAATRLRAVHWSDLLGAITMVLLQNYQCNPTENSHGCQNQAQGYRLSEENDTTQGSNDRDTKLHGSSIGIFQRR